VFCVIWSSIDVATRLETVFIITLITYDRYRSVTRPLDVMHSSKSRVARHVVTTYVMAVVLTIPFTAAGHHFIVKHEDEVYCIHL